jgi:hypothetical protein
MEVMYFGTESFFLNSISTVSDVIATVNRFSPPPPPPPPLLTHQSFVHLSERRKYALEFELYGKPVFLCVWKLLWNCTRIWFLLLSEHVTGSIWRRDITNWTVLPIYLHSSVAWNRALRNVLQRTKAVLYERTDGAYRAALDVPVWCVTRFEGSKSFQI